MRPFPAALGLTLGLAFAAPTLYAQDAPATPLEDPRTKASEDVELYRQGSLRYHQGDREGAIERFSELLEKHPQSPRAAEARFWRASALEESGRRQEALAAYRALRKLAPKSGWATDAAKRIERLARIASPDRLECRVQLTEGEPFTARLHELSSAGALLSGGEFKTPTRVPFARLVKLEVSGGAKRLLLLSNGDRISGRLLRAEPEALVVEVPGIEAPVRIPPTRLRELRSARAGVAWVGTSGHGVVGVPGPLAALRTLEVSDEDEDEVERETTLNPDGSRTTTTVDGAGRKTVTTVTRDGKGRKVLIKRGEGDETATIELKLDGGVVGEALLGDLADELPGELGERLGDVDLDLDLEIDDKELRDLDEALRELPEELRERIHRSLRGRTKRRAKQRRVWVERGRDGDEHVIILEGDEAPHRARRTTRARRAKPAKRIEKKIVVVAGEGDEEFVFEGEGRPRRPGRRVEERVVIVEGDEDEGPRRKKHVMVFEGHEDEDEVDVDVFVTPDGKKVVRKRIRKASPGKNFTLRAAPGDEEEVDVFVTPDGKKVVRKRIRKASGKALPAMEFAFGRDGHHLSKSGNQVYSWVTAEAAHQTKDRVFLRNGDTLSGKIRNLDSESMRLDTDYGRVTIRRDQIRQVSFATPKKPFLGVSMKGTARGVEVTHVHDDSAAAVAGLKVGDVIVSVGEKRAADAAPITVDALGEAIQKRRVGEVIKLWFRRGEGAPQHVEARLSERPLSTRAIHLEKARAHADLAKLHAHEELKRAQVEKLHAHEELKRAHEHLQRAEAEKLRAKKLRPAKKIKRVVRAKKLQPAKEIRPAEKLRPAKPAGKPRLGVALAEDGGAVTISQVMAGSLAARLGLEKGDRIVKLQGQAVRSISDVAAGMKGLSKGDQVSLEVSRTRGERVEVLALQFTLE